MRTTEIPTECPVCHVHNEAASHHEDEVPQDGDLSFCWTCKSITAYDSTRPGGMRELTNEEMADAMVDPGIRQMIYQAMFSSGPLDLVRRVAHSAKIQSWGDK